MTTNIEMTISNTLKELGVTPGLLGYQYLRHAIKLAMDSPDIVHSMTTKLYHEIAKHFGTTAVRVERTMRTAIERAWLAANTDAQQAIFGWSVRADRGKPTNQEFIATVADYLLLREEDSHGT